MMYANGFCVLHFETLILLDLVCVLKSDTQELNIKGL